MHAEGAGVLRAGVPPGRGRHPGRCRPPVAPSAVPDPYEAQVPHTLRDDEIEELVLAFGTASAAREEGGMDAAEIHGAHGYLVNEFFSPYFNRRDDRWGGSRENRARFPLGDHRRGPDDGGRRLPDRDPGRCRGRRAAPRAHGRRARRVCRLIGPHVAYVSVSGGNYAGFGDGIEPAYVSPWYTEPGFNVAAAAAVKRRSTCPSSSPDASPTRRLAESILARGAADMVGMVRALIADPSFRTRHAAGRSDEIRGCLGLSECHAIGPHRVPVTAR